MLPPAGSLRISWEPAGSWLDLVWILNINFPQADSSRFPRALRVQPLLEGSSKSRPRAQTRRKIMYLAPTKWPLAIPMSTLRSRSGAAQAQVPIPRSSRKWGARLDETHNFTFRADETAVFFVWPPQSNRWPAQLERGPTLYTADHATARQLDLLVDEDLARRVKTAVCVWRL